MQNEKEEKQDTPTKEVFVAPKDKNIFVKTTSNVGTYFVVSHNGVFKKVTNQIPFQKGTFEMSEKLFNSLETFKTKGNK